jgi:hypothetical protein
MAELPGADGARLAASACGLSVTVALGAGGLEAGAGAAAVGDGAAGGVTTALAAVGALPDDGRLMLRLGVIMRAVLRREDFSRQTSLGSHQEIDRPINGAIRVHSRPPRAAAARDTP